MARCIGWAALAAVGVLLAGCKDRAQREKPLPAPVASHAVTDGWIGRWTGVEGLVLTIGRTNEPGHYALTVSLLDGTDTYQGQADGDAIRFVRNGVEESIRHVSGDETGLKWLAGKRDCLMIKSGEGFCRD